MKIGILAAGSNEADLLAQFGSFAQMTETMLAGAGFDFQTWDVRLGAFPDSAAQCDGWIITGSPASVYQPLTWIAPLEQLIREVDGLKRPLVGICFGHQIIARALGGSVVKSDLGWGLGIDSYTPVGSGESLLGCNSIPCMSFIRIRWLSCLSVLSGLQAPLFVPTGCSDMTITFLPCRLILNLVWNICRRCLPRLLLST